MNKEDKIKTWVTTRNWWPQFVHNFDIDFVRDVFRNAETVEDLFAEADDAGGVIHYAFSWGSTPEGPDYWSKKESEACVASRHF